MNSGVLNLITPFSWEFVACPPCVLGTSWSDFPKQPRYLSSSSLKANIWIFQIAFSEWIAPVRKKFVCFLGEGFINMKKNFILAVENFFTQVTFESVDWFLKPVLHISVLFQSLFSWWWLVTLFTLKWHSVVWLFSTVRFLMSPQIAQITLFFKILWLNILSVSPAFTQGLNQAQTIHQKLNSWGGQSWWLMDSGLPTSGLPPSGQSWGGQSWHSPLIDRKLN